MEATPGHCFKHWDLGELVGKCDSASAGSGVGSKRVDVTILRMPEIYFGRAVRVRRYRPERDGRSLFRIINQWTLRGCVTYHPC